MVCRHRTICILVALLMLMAISLGAFPVPMSAAPAGAPVLILQSNDPTWGSPLYRTEFLPSLGYAPTVAGWSQIGTGAGQIHLADFRYIYIPSSQSGSFYDSYDARSSELADWVSAGGRLLFSVCTQGRTLTLPGGLKTSWNSVSYNYIVDASHPIVTGGLSDGAVLTNADLYGLQCSHINMNTLPAGAVVIIRDDVAPTLVEYSWGAGKIMASGLTWEAAYNLGPTSSDKWQFRKACDDLFLYTFGPLHTITVTATPGGTVTPSGSVRVINGWFKTFTIAANDGFYIASIKLDGVNIAVSDRETMMVTVSNVQSDRTLAVSFAGQGFFALSITLPKYGTMAGVTDWVDGTVPTFTVGSSPFPLSFDLHDNSGSAKWSIIVNGITIVDPLGSGTITYPVPLADGRNDVTILATNAVGNSVTQKLVITLDATGPVLTLDPILPALVTSPDLTIAGTVQDVTSGLRSLSINGTPVAVSADGSFRENLTLVTGANTIVVEAVDRIGHMTSQTFTVAYRTASSAGSSSLLVVLTIGQKSMQVNGMPVVMDAAPVIKNGRTLLPIRALIETLGGKIVWNASARSVDVSLGGRSVSVGIGGSIGYVNGKATPIDATNSKVVPEIIGNRTYLPLRFIAENLGLDLAWEPVSQTISFTYWP